MTIQQAKQKLTNWALAQVGIGATKDVVSTEAFVGGAVTVEVVGEEQGKRVVAHHAVGTVPLLQLLQLGQPLLMGRTAGGNEEDGNEKEKCCAFHAKCEGKVRK